MNEAYILSTSIQSAFDHHRLNVRNEGKCLKTKLGLKNLDKSNLKANCDEHIKKQGKRSIKREKKTYNFEVQK